MPFRDLGLNFTYYYFINSLVCVSQNLFCLIDDAKVWRFGEMGKNYADFCKSLLRQAWCFATK
jgi:hypothetical protein